MNPIMYAVTVFKGTNVNATGIFDILLSNKADFKYEEFQSGMNLLMIAT